MKCDECERNALFSCRSAYTPAGHGLYLCLTDAMRHRVWGHRPRLLRAVATKLLSGEW